MKKYVLAITGASGSIFGLRVLAELAKSSQVFVSASSSAIPIIKDETGLDLEGPHPDRVLRQFTGSGNIHFFFDTELAAPISSGSFHTDGMFVVPCSMKTLSSIAHGLAHNLIARSADVMIKEGRKLLLSPREMPFSPIHLENMLKLARIGVKIVPPVPAFYHKPESLDDLIDSIAGRILDNMGIENDLFRKWGS
jgi:4-hydroxy-3-polyprenylbenzoate decarboxylase